MSNIVFSLELSYLRHTLYKGVQVEHVEQGYLGSCHRRSVSDCTLPQTSCPNVSGRRILLFRRCHLLHIVCPSGFLFHRVAPVRATAMQDSPVCTRRLLQVHLATDHFPKSSALLVGHVRMMSIRAVDHSTSSSVHESSLKSIPARQHRPHGSQVRCASRLADLPRCIERAVARPHVLLTCSKPAL